MDIEFVRGHFRADRYLMLTEVVIEEIGEDFCRCRMEVSQKHFNAAGMVQGGAIYTLADSAFAVSSNIGHLERGEDLVTISQSATINYLRAVQGGTLYAEGRKIGGGKKMALYRMDVTDEEGRLVATMNGNAYTVPKR
jgi:acyl-CoA thioesterase